MTQKRRTNILWICSDQQRYDTLGCYGNDFVRTPNLDALAARGTRFTSAFCQNPVCTPSRGAFLTGRYPRTCRCRQNGADIPKSEVLVTKLLADEGYRCGLSGKLHLSACNAEATPEMERRIDDGYSDFHWSHHSGPGWGANNEYWAWLAEKGAEFAWRKHPDTRFIRLGPPEELHQTTWCAEKAIDFMEARANDRQPWLFSVNMFDPHHPFDAPEEYLQRYVDALEDIPLPNYEPGELDGKPDYQRQDHANAYSGMAQYPYDEMTDRDHRLCRASYWAMCDLIDAQVGRMLDALERTGQLESTLVIFTSDHGELLGDHGMYLKGPHFYEPCVRVPLIVAGPGVEENRTADGLVELLDLPQTILDAAGIDHHPGMQGRSLWPILSGDANVHRHRDDVYSEYYCSMVCHQDPKAHVTMVRTDRWKLTVDHPNSFGELYDLENDPSETHNLWNSPEAAGVKSDMLLRLCNRMAWTVDPLPERRAPW